MPLYSIDLEPLLTDIDEEGNLPRKCPKRENDEDDDTFQQQCQSSRTTQIRLVHLMVLDTMVLDQLIIGQNPLLQVNHFRVILEDIITNQKATIEINHLGNMQFAVSWFV